VRAGARSVAPRAQAHGLSGPGRTADLISRPSNRPERLPRPLARDVLSSPQGGAVEIVCRRTGEAMEPLGTTATDTASLVREHRAWFEVCRDTALTRDGRRTVGVSLRIWGLLPAGAAGMPGCPQSRATCLALTRLAEAVVARAERGAEAEIEPFRSALYASRAEPGRDEISLSIAVRSRAGLSQGGHDDRERRLRELARRLTALGVHEGGWREAVRPAAPAAEEAWQVRPTARVFQMAPRAAAPQVGLPGLASAHAA
jgi:hypothetical protein